MIIRYAVVIVAMVVGATASTASAQNPLDGLFKAVGELLGDEPERPARAVRPAQFAPPAVAVKDNVKADFVNMYTPFVKKVLTTELYFVKKVCQPADEEFDEIHRAGLLEVAITSKHYEELQKIRQSANQWPDPRVRISAALMKQIKESVSDEAAEKYSQEIAARAEAHQDAAAGMMLVHIDAELLLSPDQHDEIAETLKGKWNKAWSSGPRLFMYPQYARLPESHVLRPHLSDLQRTLWSQRSNNSSVNFGWQMELGLQDWFGVGVELEAFEPPGPAEPNAADDAAKDNDTEKREA